MRRPAISVRRERRWLVPAFLVVSLDTSARWATLTVLPFYLTQLGATPLMLGVVMGAEALSQLVAGPWVGQLSDRYGRKRVLLVCQIGAVASLVLLGLASTAPMVLLARILLGFTAASATVVFAYAADNSTPAQRRSVIGVLSAGLGVGGMAGPAVAGFVSESSMTAAIWMAAGLSVVTVAVTAMFVRESPGVADTGSETDPARERMSLRTIAADPVIRIIVVCLLCHFFAYGIFTSGFPVFLHDTFSWRGHEFGPTELGYLLTADGAINVVVQMFVLRWIGSRISERNLIMVVFLLLAVGYLLFGLARTLPMLGVAVLLICAAAAMARPTFVAAVSVHVPSGHQGVVMGATGSLVAVTDVATPVLAGLILSLGWYAGWTGLAVSVAAVGCVIASTRLRSAARPRQDELSWS